MARPTKYNDEVVERILHAIRLGATYDLACSYGGISADAFAAWRKKYPDFAEKVKDAEGSGAVGWLDKIEAAARDGNWQAAAWKLERRYPHAYGRNVTEVTGDLIVRKYVGVDVGNV